MTVPRLAELNAYVPVRNLGGQSGQEITVDLIKGFQVCVTHKLSIGSRTERTRDRLWYFAVYRSRSSWKSMTGHMRMACTSFLPIPAVSSGKSKIQGRTNIWTYKPDRIAFNDFGPKFTCVDPTGEQPLSGMIVSVDKVQQPSCCALLRIRSPNSQLTG